MLPGVPDLTAVRELTVSPFLRSPIKVETVGSVQIQITTVLSGFDAYGVKAA
jgi:hypothetical protein